MAEGFARLFGMPSGSVPTVTGNPREPASLPTNSNPTYSFPMSSGLHGSLSPGNLPDVNTNMMGSGLGPLDDLQMPSSFDPHGSEPDTSIFTVGSRRPRLDEPPALRNRVPGQLLRITAREKALAAGLPPDDVKSVEAFCDIVDIKIMIIVMGKDLIKRFFVIHYRHPDFNTYLCHNVAGVLFSATTPVYLNGLLCQLVVWMEKNPTRLGLPPSV
ncbi:hypothetical protein C8Q72DRAFT_220884 [Fomitopsis betulina]|nr:hypothetical protein C8Q72DRAFT_220884 [Fomitopsis betulina]